MKKITHNYIDYTEQDYILSLTLNDDEFYEYLCDKEKYPLHQRFKYQQERLGESKEAREIFEREFGTYTQEQIAQLMQDARNLHAYHAYCAHSIEQINEMGVFTVEKTDDPNVVIVSLNDDVVISKANFKAYVSIVLEGGAYFARNQYFKKKKNDVSNWYIYDLLEISRKTRKYNNAYLKEILDNRLSGVYKEKAREGKNWNAGGHLTPDQQQIKEAEETKALLNVATQNAQERADERVKRKM